MPNLNPEAAFESLKGQVAATLKAQFPFEGAVRRLELVDVIFEEKSGSAADPHHIDNLEEQLKARTTGMTWGVPVRGRLRLVDKASGHLIEEASVTLAKLPKLTRRYSYLIDGQERQHDSVFRSKSRAYHRIASNGDIQARWNLARGHGFDLTYDPVKGRMVMKIGDSNVPLYSVLHILNVGDASMERAWGPEVFRDNQKASKPGDVDKVYTALRLRMADRSAGTPAQRAEKIREYFEMETEVLPGAMKAAFGKEYTTVNGENLLLSSARLLDIQKGRSKEDPPAHELPDDRQALSAKTLATTEDFVIEALRDHETSLRKQVHDRIDKPEYSISDIMSPNTYGRVVLAPFQHAQRPEQTNPLQFLSGYMRTTIRGKEFGGVGGEKINLDVEKELNPTHLGFIDPIQTPEGEDTGIALNLPLGISVTRATASPGSKSRSSPGQEIRTKVYDTRSRQLVLATPAELEHAVVAYPDQVRWSGGHPTPIADEVVCYDEQRKTSKRPWGKVRYVLPSAKALLSFSANLIPFLQNNNGNRAMMAAKQQEQALALVRREAPLVQVKTDGTNTFEHVVGSFVTHTAPAAGVVKSVEPGAVHLQTADGLVRVPMYNHFPLNGGKNSLHSIPVVKAGQSVQKGELLADSNYTKDGALALGSNLRVAYVPWKGLTFEDGIVVSESAAKRMSSDHMHALEVTVYASMLGATEGALSRWRDYATPQRSTPEHIHNLDARGIVREGSVVHSGDVLVAILSPKQSSESDRAAGLIHKTLAKSYRDASLVWDHDYSGKVVRVLISEAMNRKHITVHITTEQPLVVGDKLSGRHGNKGIISRIVQDHEMPHTADGVPADLLLNPAGVPSRMNVGQVLETAASKIAEKTGKPYIVENFVPGVDYSAKVTQELKKHGLTDTEEMFDPVTKRSIGQIMVGKQYMLKLHHQVEKKATARSMESGYTHTGEAPKGSGIPGGGQKMDMLTTYAMLAHGANHNLREAYTFKSDGDQNAAWAAVITGNPLPPPQPTRGMSHFQNYLRALGVNVEKRKDDYHLSPLTDMHLLGDAKRGIRGISNGAIKLPEKLSVARGARTVEEHGGLFDPRVTGGIEGKFWSHVELAERMPSPLFEPAIQTLTGLTKKQFDAMVGEKGYVDGKSGFHTIIERLGAINVDEELKKAQAEVGKSSRATLNRSMKKVRYLEALKANGLTPLEAYTNKYLPVLPPSVRRVSIGLDGTQVVDDRNPLYLGVGHANGVLKEAKPSTPHEDLQKARASLYSSIRSLRMTGMTTSPGSGKPRHMQGLMELLSGKTEDHGAPKESFFQEGVLARRQDLSGRSTIVPEPGLGLDQVGVPRQIAMEMYKPFVVRELVRGGKTPIEALKWAKEKKDHPQVMDALERAVAERPVFLKRDPSLHKFSIMAFHPKIVDGSAIKIHPLVTGGFNADFDGDQQLGTVFLLIPWQMYNADVTFWESRRVEMTARVRECIGYENGNDELVFCDLEDFPHGELLKRKGHIDFYEVPPGMRVIGLDEDTGTAGLYEVSSWSVHHDRVVEIVTLGSGRQIITDDDERAVFGVDADSLRWCRRRPREAMNQYVPVMTETPVVEKITSIPVDRTRDRDRRLRETFGLGAAAGYFFGAMVGDGWVTGADGDNRYVCFSSSYQSVQDHWQDCLRFAFFEIPVITDTETTQGLFEGSKGSWRAVISCAAFADFVAPMIGHGAQRKHLPPFFLKARSSFCHGLLSGLWDTDGSFNWSNSKGKPQFQASYSSTSIRLVQEVQHLLRTFAVTSTITSSRTPAGEPHWVLTLSTPELYDALNGRGLIITPMHAEKKAALRLFMQSGRPDKSGAYSRYRLVPLPPALAADLRKIITHTVDASIYASLSKALQSTPRKHLSKELALRVVELVGDRCTHPLYADWRALVQNVRFHFEQVAEYERTDIEETGFDLTVPGAETFMSVDGVVLSNTMALYVPVSAEAVEEAHKMLPSKNLFSPTHFGLLPVPGQDSLLGIFQATKWGTEVKVPDGTTAERAMQMMHDGKLKPTDVILIDGKKTTAGRLSLAKLLPAEMQGGEKLLHDASFRLNKDGVEQMLSKVAREHDKGFATTVDGWKDLGNHLSYLNGSSFSIHDFHDGVAMRDRILKPYEEKEKELHATPMSSRKRDQEIVKLYQGAQAELKRVGKAKYDAGGNRVWEWAESGARGNWNQFAQLTLAPVLVEDFARRTVPIPITKSFGEGLSVSEYWASMHGARKGTLDRAQGTREPGAVQKDIVNTTMGIQVTAADCGATDGKKMPVGHNDLVGRFLAHAVKLGTVDVAAGELITPALVSQARNAGVHELVVRSPLFCRMGKGVCAKSLIPETMVVVSPGPGLWPLHVSLEDLFEMVPVEPILLADGTVQKLLPVELGWAIQDADEWTALTRVLHHQREAQKRLYELKTSSGRTLHLTEDHTMVVARRTTICPDCDGTRISVGRTSSTSVHLHCRECGSNFTVSLEVWDKTAALEIRADEMLPGDLFEIRDVPVRAGMETPGLDPYFLGAYLAEGSVSWGEQHPRKVTIAQHVTSVARTAMLEAARRVTVNKVSEREDVLEISDVRLVRALRDLVGEGRAEKKWLGSSWMAWPDRYVAGVFSGLFDGDGSARLQHNKYTEASIGSTSYRLLVQIQMWLQSLGVRAALSCNTQEPSGGVRSRQDMFHLTFTPTGDLLRMCSSVKLARVVLPEHQRSLRERPRVEVLRKLRDVSDKIHAKRVFDVTTASNTFMANGLHTHNCYGHNERGGLHPVGTNLGVIAGQALSEPITQLAMKCSEGVVTDSAGTAWAMEDYFAAHGVDAPTGDEVRTKTLAGAMLADGDDDVHAFALQTHMPDAEMVFIKTRSGHALAVQANHPLWVYGKDGREAVKPAGELVPGVDYLRVDRAAALVPGDQRCPLHPYVVGFFLAEGSTRYGNGTPRYDNVAVASVFSQHDTPQKAKLEHALLTVPGIGTVSAHEKCVEVYDPVFARELADVVRGRTSYVKRLQPGFNRWSDSDLTKLLGGWIDGDGTVFVKSGVMVAKLYTSSFVALQQLEIICAKLGIRCSSGYVSRPDERVQVESRHANFFAELRFRETSGNVWQHSLRMQAKGPLLFAKHRLIDNDLDYVKKVQVMPKWITPVWDVKTSSQGFTCGMLRNHNTFHTGGVSSAGQSSAVDSFKRVKQLFMVPDKLPDKATIATVGGTVGKIVADARGGFTVDIEGTAHRVVTGHLLDGIKTGTVVHRGDPISTGPLDPRELLEHTKSIGRTRNYITDEATAAYQGTVRQRNVEMVVRGMTNLTEVHNAPHGSPWHQGDLAPLSAVEEHNANAAMEGHAAIEHTPTLRAMTLVPLSGTEDWMARLNYQRLKDTYTEGAAQGWKSNIHDHPIPGLAHGAEFGLHPPKTRAPPPSGVHR